MSLVQRYVEFETTTIKSLEDISCLRRELMRLLEKGYEVKLNICTHLKREENDEDKKDKEQENYQGNSEPHEVVDLTQCSQYY